MSLKIDQRVKVADPGSQHHGRTGVVAHAYGPDGDRHCTVVFDADDSPHAATDRLPEAALAALKEE